MNARILTIAILALGMAGCGTYGSRYGDGGNYSSGSGYRLTSNCYDCGVVRRIDSFDDGRRSSGVGGAVAGAVIGGVVGSQVGSGSGRDVATVAGAVAGGLAGRDMQRNSGREHYEITVQMNRGGQVRVQQAQLNGIREGAQVVVRNGRVQLY